MSDSPMPAPPDDMAEMGSLASELARAYRRMAAFYHNQLELDGPAADTRARDLDAGSIVTRMQPTDDALTLRYSIRASDGGEWQPISEQIDLEATPCHYGGSRLWLICPTCQSQRRVLYSLGGRFRCRQCHDLAYTSTRDDAHDRSLRRIRKLQKRLSSTTSDLFEVPPKPPGMHWDTYEGIASQLIQENSKRMRLLIAQREALIERLDRHMS